MPGQQRLACRFTCRYRLSPLAKVIIHGEDRQCNLTVEDFGSLVGRSLRLSNILSFTFLQN